ncbi:hypothetical protein TcasGA2_TC005259 [Tribolium castaneum]|uniref:DUF4817 domain-containing protein n=1 Tax=Tribolium castaneum TaxID=7070 RepID=D7EK43_TRICA|nr:hypothetical protein TcasGA2_TC005259 [Tribolium castaneum]
MLSNQEKREIILVYGESGRSLQFTTRVLQERFLQVRYSLKKVRKIIRLFEDTSSVVKPKRVYFPVRHNDALVHVVRNAVEEDPSVSTRIIVRQHNISKSSVQRILKSNKFHPYKISTMDATSRPSKRQLIFMHDGVPLHFARRVRRHLDRHLPERWIGRGGSLHWPARSPDLTPCDFFLWGVVKEKVYKTAPTTVDDMKDRIRAAFAEITPEILIRVKRSFRDRLLLCLQAIGNAFEH